MKEETAHMLIELLARHAGEQNDILADIEAIESSTEFKRICTMIGRTMGSIYLEALNPIFDEDPDMKPQHLR